MELLFFLNEMSFDKDADRTRSLFQDVKIEKPDHFTIGDDGCSVERPGTVERENDKRDRFIES